MARLIEVERALGHVFEPPPSRWDERDVALYALATGAADDPTDERQLRRAVPVRDQSPLPADGMVTAGLIATLALNALVSALKSGKHAPGLTYGIDRVLHERHSVELVGPLPRASGTLAHRGRIAAIYDTGRHGIVVTEVETRDERGDLVVRSEITSLVRSAGGFGGPKRVDETGEASASDRIPDLTVEQSTRANQALLYRLLGDDNPIHADARAARTFGLRRPILHGMCTFGFALRHVLDGIGGGDASLLRSVSVRFSDVVYPGETLITEAWRQSEGLVHFQTRTKERGTVVLSQGQARLGAIATLSSSTTASR